jgi:GcrA cell cycle regulator
MVWDEGTIRLLRELWAEGLSTAEIGRRLGVSKNAIVGKAHRLELEARPSPIRRDSTKPVSENVVPLAATLPPLPSDSPALVVPVIQPPSVVPETPRAIVVPPPPAPPPPAPPRPVPQPVLRRANLACCWPIGEPGTRSFRFCDGSSVPGKPYCEEHIRLAYVRIKDRKEEAA